MVVDIGDLLFDGSLADVAVIVRTLCASRGIDDNIHLAVGHMILDVGASLGQLVHLFAAHAMDGVSKLAVPSVASTVEALEVKDLRTSSASGLIPCSPL
jgi:hypothetical protein